MIPQKLIRSMVCLGCLAGLGVVDAQDPGPTGKADLVAPKPFSQFGLNPERANSPAMLEALRRMHEAGLVEGQRGSLTFFRWADSNPPKLAHLGLWGPKVGNEILALASLLPDLEHVSVYETNVDDQGIQALGRLPKLRSLAITPINRYEKAGFAPPQWSYPFMPLRDDRPRVSGQALPALSHIATLESLDLLDARLKSSDLSVLSSWLKLSSLSLPNVIDEQAVVHLQACRRLSVLTLGHREVTAAELKCLAHWKSLKRLTLIHAQLSDEALAALSKLESVEELHLEDCGLTDERLRYLQGSPNLTSLVLKRNEINGPGLAYLVKLNLQGLGLEFNNLNDETLIHLPQLTSVEDLALSYCRNVTDRGMQSGTLQGMTHLKRLGLRGMQQVTDASLDDLVKLGHLEHLTIRETKISADGVARMKQAMPKTVVFK